MKTKIFWIVNFFFFSITLFSQTVPVKFHYTPTYTEFETLRIVGTLNGWNNADDEMIMTDEDADGEYELTVDLADGVEYNYKFVMDADWGLAYYDPDNPNINIQDNNNSVISVKDPMIVYLLPRDVNTAGDMFVDTSAEGLPIRAIFAFNEGLEIYVFQVSIDGTMIDSPLQYLDMEKQEFLYEPTEPLSSGDHVISLTMVTNRGTIQASSTFKRLPGFVTPEAPFDFYFDANGSRTGFAGTVNSAAAVGTFNNWNDKFHLMQDNDNDGLWEATVVLEEGSYDYKFKLNGDLWINDPDEPNYEASADDNNTFTVTVDTEPSIKLIGPNDLTVFNVSDTTFTFRAYLRPGGLSGGVDTNEISLKLNDNAVDYSYDASTSIVSAEINLNTEGNHIVEVGFDNTEGSTATAEYSYAIYSGETGVYYVDGAHDKHYQNPAGMISTSNDIQYVKIDETATHDSLQFTIALDGIDDRTRVGMIITNPSSQLIDAPFDLDIKVYDWTEGVFAVLAKPGNQYENTTYENQFLENPNAIASTGEMIVLDSAQIANGVFSFTVSAVFLDNILTSWIDIRDIYIFSYIAKEDGSGDAYEVTPAVGAPFYAEDPNIYDAAFIRSSFWQQRMFDSYIISAQRHGPRYVALDGTGRGKISLRVKDISDSLETHGVVVRFLTPSADYWYSNVTVHGTISDTTITSATFIFNGNEETISVQNGRFEIPVVLLEGNNTVQLRVVEEDEFTTISRELVLGYRFDKTPLVAIAGSVSGRDLSLHAEYSSPANLELSFLWEEEVTNPSVIGQTSTSNTFNFSVPEVDGEYILKLTVTDSEGNTAYAKKMIYASSDSVSIASINDHAAWIDSAVVYEIYPRSFTEQGGFNGIVDRIPNMLDLGINCVWLMPIYDGPSTHGYEITDYLGFEEDYGTETDFIAMVSALHDAGIRVILDYVVNHTAYTHPFMQNVIEYGEYSPWADFYIWSGEPGNSSYEYYFDWASLPNLNHDNVEVRNYFIDVAKQWVLKYDIDGYRCDVAWGVEERNTDFWQEWRRELKNIKPSVFLEAEASSGESVFYQQRFDSANDWDLRNKIIGAISGTESIANLDTELRRSYPYYARPFRFVENHDENRIASTFDTKRSKLSHTIFFMANGVPLIYSGAEVGELTYRDLISWSDPDNVLPYFKRMVEIRKQFLVNPTLERITNTDPINVYSFASISDTNIVVTAANLRSATKSVSLDLSNLPLGDGEIVYFTNLVTGEVIEVTSDNINSIQIEINGFEAALFYYGTEIEVVSTESGYDEVITEYKLFNNYPNPFNPSTRIVYQVPQMEKVVLKVFDILGREITTLVNEVQDAGKYEVTLDARRLASGVYFYSLQSGSFTKTRKMLLLK